MNLNRNTEVFLLNINFFSALISTCILSYVPKRNRKTFFLEINRFDTDFNVFTHIVFPRQHEDIFLERSGSVVCQCWCRLSRLACHRAAMPNTFGLFFYFFLVCFGRPLHLVPADVCDFSFFTVLAVFCFFVTSCVPSSTPSQSTVAAISDELL